MHSLGNITDSTLKFPAGPLGVDDAVGVSQAKWFVAIVNPRHEKSVAQSLGELDIESYVAIQQEMHQWKNGKRKMVDRVVIPSMVFVKCTEKQRRDIVKLPFILRFLVNRSSVNPDSPFKPVAVISESEIRNLKFMLGQSDHPVTFIPMVFKAKDRVKVIRGKLCGLIGEIQSNSDGTHQLIVNLSLLGGASVFIDPCDVQKI